MASTTASATSVPSLTTALRCLRFGCEHRGLGSEDRPVDELGQADGQLVEADHQLAGEDAAVGGVEQVVDGDSCQVRVDAGRSRGPDAVGEEGGPATDATKRLCDDALIGVIRQCVVD